MTQEARVTGLRVRYARCCGEHREDGTDQLATLTSNFSKRRNCAGRYPSDVEAPASIELRTFLPLHPTPFQGSC